MSFIDTAARRFANGLILAVLPLAGCGGGGGSTPAMQVATANTSSPYYLPLASGNTWAFADGERMADTGSLTVQCTCPINGLVAENVDSYSSTSAYVGSFIFTKLKSTTTGSLQTILVGTSQTHGQAITLITDGTHDGIAVMDDAAFAGESSTLGGTTSTITSVGGTQPYGTSTIQFVNVDRVTESQGSFSWSFARGVGFAGLAIDSQSTNLASFTINVAASQSVARRVATVTDAPATEPQPSSSLLGKAILRIEAGRD